MDGCNFAKKFINLQILVACKKINLCRHLHFLQQCHECYGGGYKQCETCYGRGTVSMNKVTVD